MKTFSSLTLAKQFFIAGGLITLMAMIAVGFFLTRLIADAVTYNSAAATALYVDSVIAPILPDLTTAQEVDETIERVLDETLSQGALANRLISFRLWRGDGTVLYSSDKSLMGKKVPPDSDLRRAFEGRVVAEFELDDDEDPAGAVPSNEPILEIYNPIHQPWSGEVIAVAEFYEHANELNRSLGSARWKSWLAVVAVAGSFFLTLSAIVFKGSRTIESQRRALGARVEELGIMLQQNQELSNRVRSAAQKTAALNERFLRRVSADLHDGPLQLLAYASMRIDSPLIRDGRGSRCDRKLEVETIQKSLNDAITEVRTICRGLALPDIEALPLTDILKRAVATYEARTGADVEVSIDRAFVELPPSARICIYRFVQEALNNGWKHAEGKGQRVEQWLEKGTLVVAVSDSGPGFTAHAVRSEGLGLSGLKERIESLGGWFEVVTCSTGTTLRMSLEVDELETA